MLAHKNDVYTLYRCMAATAIMWTSVGAGVGAIVTGHHMVAVGLLCLALVLYPFRLKFTVRRIKADSFEEAMREIERIEREERQ